MAGPGWSRREALAALGAAGASAAGAAGAQTVDTEPTLPAVGAALRLPDFPLLDGRTLRAADADAHVLLLYWWASWCPFCAQQSPLIDQFWRSHRERGLRLVGLSIDRKAEDASGYLAKRGYVFPVAMVTPAIARVLPKPKGLPVTLLRGRDGRVLAAEAGQLFPEDIEQFARFLA